MSKDHIIQLRFFGGNSKIYSYIISTNLLEDFLDTFGVIRIEDVPQHGFIIENSEGYNYRESYVNFIQSFSFPSIYIEESKNTYKRITAIYNSNNILICKDNSKYISKNDNEINFKKEYKEEKKPMKSIFKNIKFGPCDSNLIGYSFQGIAYKTVDREWVSYNIDEEELVNVTEFLIPEFSKFLYYLPAGIDNINVGDIIIHNGKPVFVIDITGSKFECIDPCNKEVITILPEKSIFGFNFITKVVDLSNGAFSSAFGSDGINTNSLLPFILMNDETNNSFLPFLLMNQNGGMDNNNLLLMMAMSKGNFDTNSLLPLMLMQNGSLFNK